MWKETQVHLPVDWRGASAGAVCGLAFVCVDEGAALWAPTELVVIPTGGVAVPVGCLSRSPPGFEAVDESGFGWLTRPTVLVALDVFFSPCGLDWTACCFWGVPRPRPCPRPRPRPMTGAGFIGFWSLSETAHDEKTIFKLKVSKTLSGVCFCYSPGNLGALTKVRRSPVKRTKLVRLGGWGVRKKIALRASNGICIRIGLRVEAWSANVNFVTKVSTSRNCLFWGKEGFYWNSSLMSSSHVYVVWKCRIWKEKNFVREETKVHLPWPVGWWGATTGSVCGLAFICVDEGARAALWVSTVCPSGPVVIPTGGVGKSTINQVKFWTVCFPYFWVGCGKLKTCHRWMFSFFSFKMTFN